jgi:hypothetical protein
LELQTLKEKTLEIILYLTERVDSRMKVMKEGKVRNSEKMRRYFLMLKLYSNTTLSKRRIHKLMLSQN